MYKIFYLTPLSGNTSPTVFKILGAALDKNLPTLVSLNFLLIYCPPKFISPVLSPEDKPRGILNFASKGFLFAI